MFIVVWDLGGKTVSVLGFCSPIGQLQAQTGPCWKEVSSPPPGGRALPSVVGRIVLLDSRLSVSQQSSQDA